VKAASGALRNLAVDARNKELIGKELAVSRHLSICYRTFYSAGAEFIC